MLMVWLYGVHSVVIELCCKDVLGFKITRMSMALNVCKS